MAVHEASSSERIPTVNQVFLTRAIEIARRSPVKTFQTGAVIVQRGKVVSAGWSHPSIRTLQNYRSVHAELHAIIRTDPRELAGAEIYVATIRRKSGNIGLGKPCDACADILFEVGIETAYFTDEDGYGKLRLY